LGGRPVANLRVATSDSRRDKATGDFGRASPMQNSSGSAAAELDDEIPF